MCGGTASAVSTASAAKGLSPRVRGNHVDGAVFVGDERSIPACAGEPRRQGPARSRFAVYPRVCGGTFPFDFCHAGFYGLSPRVRGNRVPAPALGGPPGSIPACAGEPACSSAACSRFQVYPRVCGGTPGTRPAALGGPGLSPRVRGNRWRCRRTSGWRRSIPACAGEPCDVSPNAAGVMVYPRVCGGTPPTNGVKPKWTGLSPRVRGNPGHHRRAAALERSIPACAGEPWRCLSFAAAREVYPRVCGGTPNVASGGLGHYWSIPACAGEPE